MSDTKWTPGPWVAEDCWIMDKDDDIVAMFVNGAVSRDSPEEDCATAKLVAAAPDLYEALEVLVDSLDDEYVASGLGESEPAKLALGHEVGIALKAMAKARGEHND